ncbi:MAG: hypothetical protein ACLRZ9_01070 [Eubacterium sp.]
MWDYLQEYCKNIPFLYSKAKIKKIVKEQYEEKTGEELTKNSICYVEEFDHGGMSSGKIDGNFWIDTAIPLLIKNYKKKNRKRWFYMKVPEDFRPVCNSFTEDEIDYKQKILVRYQHITLMELQLIMEVLLLRLWILRLPEKQELLI